LERGEKESKAMKVDQRSVSRRIHEDIEQWLSVGGKREQQQQGEESNTDINLSGVRNNRLWQLFSMRLYMA